MTERRQAKQEKSPDPEYPAPQLALASADGWQIGWTKHGTMCMTRGIRILNRPQASADTFERYGREARG